MPRDLPLDRVAPPEPLPDAQRIGAGQLGAGEAAVAGEGAPVRPRGLHQRRVERLADALPPEALVHEGPGDAEGVGGPAEPDQIVGTPAAQRDGRLALPLAGGGDLSEPGLLLSLPLRVEHGDERVVAVGHGRDPVADPGGLPVRRALLDLRHDEVVGVAQGGGQQVAPEGLAVPGATKVQRG